MFGTILGGMAMDVIRQKVKLPGKARELFDAFLDSRKHSAFTGMPAKTSRKVGGKFTAFAGMIWGRNLVVDPKGLLIVQAWRSTHFRKGMRIRC